MGAAWTTRLPPPRVIAAGIGAGRVAIGVSFLSAPVAGLRLMGLDTATAGRVAWLARTAGIRDVALGVGTLATLTARRDETAWLLAGAGCDAVDATVMGAAARDGRIDRLRGALVSAGAAATVVATVFTVVAARRGADRG